MTHNVAVYVAKWSFLLKVAIQYTNQLRKSFLKVLFTILWLMALCIVHVSWRFRLHVVSVILFNIVWLYSWQKIPLQLRVWQYREPLSSVCCPAVYFTTHSCLKRRSVCTWNPEELKPFTVRIKTFGCQWSSGCFLVTLRMLLNVLTVQSKLLAKTFCTW